MKTGLKRLLVLLLGKEKASRFIYSIQFKKLSQGEKSFSQEGEDRLLANLFRNKRSGFYVDIGAHHPFFLSNTHLFYLQGWRGLNVDASPECMSFFEKLRKRDINITSGVGNKTGKLMFHSFEEAALSTFDEALSIERQASGRKLRKKVSIEIQPLEMILKKYLPPGTEIDFMSVDVEGMDLDVLKSNDWKVFKPKVLLVECLGLQLDKLPENETYNFLKSHGYTLFSKLVNTCVFIDKSRVEAV